MPLPGVPDGSAVDWSYRSNPSRHMIDQRRERYTLERESRTKDGWMEGQIDKLSIYQSVLDWCRNINSKTKTKTKRGREGGGKEVNTGHLSLIRHCAKCFHLSLKICHLSSQKGYFLTGGVWRSLLRSIKLVRVIWQKKNGFLFSMTCRPNSR